MKKVIFTFVVCLCFISILKSQDIIVMRNGDEIKAKVLEITLDELKYKMSNNPDGPTIVVSKKDVFMVKYQNGIKQIFEEQNEVSHEQQQQDVAQSDYDKGCNDASFSYKANGPLWGTIGASVGCIIPAGLITAIAVGSTPPSIKNLKMDYSMMKNENYIAGYRDTAFKIKKRNAWKGFFIVGGLELALMFVAAAL